MTRPLVAAAMALAALSVAAPWAFAEMANSGAGTAATKPSGSQVSPDSSVKTSASASATASSSSSSSGKTGCESVVRSTAEAVAGGMRSYDHDEKSVKTSDEGCTASAHSSATADTRGNTAKALDEE